MADLSTVTFRSGSYHFSKPAPWQITKACLFYNTSACRNGTACPYLHKSDKRSLRLVLDGPNICKAHLLGEHGCEFSRKDARDGAKRRCWYSHDLTRAGLPLHNTALLKEHLVQLEGLVFHVLDFETWAKVAANGEMLAPGQISEAEFGGKGDEIREDGAERAVLFGLMLEAKAGFGEIERATEGEAPHCTASPEPPALDVKGLSGADLLRACGVEEPFAALKERRFVRVDFGWGMDVDDDDDDDHIGFGSGFGGFSDSDVEELACQGVKPWDDDAGAVLSFLNGGF